MVQVRFEVGQLARLLREDPPAAEALRAQLASINALLDDEEEMPPHHEPTRLPALSSRAPAEGVDSDWLQALRRFAARHEKDPSAAVTPLAEGEDPAEDPVLDEAYDALESHLICHSDCDGLYFPEASDIVIDFSGEVVPGGTLGSSALLLEELRRVAPSLGVRLDPDGALDDPEAARLASVNNSASPYWRELRAWLALFEAARLSVEHGAAITLISGSSP